MKTIEETLDRMLDLAIEQYLMLKEQSKIINKMTETMKEIEETTNKIKVMIEDK